MSENKKVGAGDPGQITEEAAAEPPPVPQGLPLRKKKYQMESDIFGTGMNPTATAGSSRHSCPANPNGPAELSDSFDRLAVGSEDASRMVPAGKPSPSISANRNVVLGRAMEDDSQSPGPSERMETDNGRQRNARENGGNPLTGEGYATDERAQSQRRQYRRYNSTPLW